MGFDRTAFLTTGSGGQLGRALGRLLPDAVHLDRAALDVTDGEAVRRAVGEHRPLVIVNTAAFTKVDLAEAEPERARQLNAVAPGHLAQAADGVGALLVQLSTDYVFGGEKGTPYGEGDETGPSSVYGKTKLMGEEQAARANRHLIVRTSWVFGNGHNFVRSILRAAESQSELTVIGDQTGLPTYAEDLARGLVALVDSGATGLFHLAGGGPPGSWADVAGTAVEARGLPVMVRRTTTAEYYATSTGPIAPRPAYSVLDCSKAASFGVRLRPWREAVVEYVRELKEVR